VIIIDNKIDYAPHIPTSARLQSGFGIASTVAATLLLSLAVVVRLDVLEALSLQFYFYAFAFLGSLTLGCCGLAGRSRKHTAAWVGIAVSLLGACFKIGSLYFLMRSCVSRGWMSMPWPLH